MIRLHEVDDDLGPKAVTKGIGTHQQKLLRDEVVALLHHDLVQAVDVHAKPRTRIMWERRVDQSHKPLQRIRQHSTEGCCVRAEGNTDLTHDSGWFHRMNDKYIPVRLTNDPGPRSGCTCGESRSKIVGRYAEQPVVGYDTYHVTIDGKR